MFGDLEAEPAAPTEEDPLRVLICDEHDLVRRSLTALLEETGVEVVAETSDGPTAVREAVHTAPDLVFVSLVLPGVAGTHTVQLLTSAMPGVEVIALAVEEPADERFRALRAGACGVLDKDELLDQTEAGTAPMGCVAPAIGAEMANLLLDRFDDLVEGAGLPPLTSRERSVLEGLAADRDLDAVAEELDMVAGEARNHLVNVLLRLRAGAPLDVPAETAARLVSAS